ncbi:neuropilin and tolloid-like protein 1 isoform X2 [Aethina tumida]|uniref:neuropilin and tolloid-like protein 1 isoform X2 n=1 Tax=Aethina tumida TaxID=116153 RepID=UPI00096ADAEC|nr:neuropilin and tolloid-like protein 1 isoform X2 [Aethina tumida]
MYQFYSVLITVFVFPLVENKVIDLYEICDQHYAKRVYLEFSERGTLIADSKKSELESHIVDNNFGVHKKCSVEFITCPSCIINIKFKYLNISRTCGRATVYDGCGCDYVWIYEPPFEEVSGEQFCGRFLDNSTGSLSYVSQTKNVAVTFIYSTEYNHAFTLDFASERNRIVYNGYPKLPNMNNASQILTSPFFPYYYPSDLSMEHVINCETTEMCRISLVFSDFQLARSSIIEFFDWNGQRMFVTDGDIFRPPVIVSSGPSLTIRFYANGAFNYGFKASYSFLLGNLNDMTFKPDTGCGGYVNNLGGGITMMKMVQEGTKYFDCVWIITPPSTTLHLKTHLYVKVVTFNDFGPTELIIRQGLTSNEPAVESIKQSLSYFTTAKEKEHVVPIKQGFYISLKGFFRRESRLAMVYAAFNYKDCYAGSDFLCSNFRCISVLLNCDGFDHCGDNSDESTTCSESPKDRRYRSNTPNFFFPKVEHYSDVSTATMIFLICGFGLIGVIVSLALLLYRVNMRARHQRRIQDHIETIHAILEESVGEVEEEIIIPDDPPDYEAPPEYMDVIKRKRAKKCNRCSSSSISVSNSAQETCTITIANSSKSCQTTPLPTSPPPPYLNDRKDREEEQERGECSQGGSSLVKPLFSVCLDHIRNVFSWNELEVSLRHSFRYYKSKRFAKNVMPIKCASDSDLRYICDYDMDNYWPRNENSAFTKSFSSDDINGLCQGLQNDAF